MRVFFNHLVDDWPKIFSSHALNMQRLDATPRCRTDTTAALLDTGLTRSLGRVLASELVERPNLAPNVRLINFDNPFEFR